MSYFQSIHTPVYTCATMSLRNNNTDNDNKFKRAKTSPILSSCQPQNLQPQIKSFSVAYFVIIYSVDGIYCICIWSLMIPGESNTAGLYRNVRVSSLEGGEGGLAPHNLSMSLYFLRRMETWSLKRTGSRRN